MTEFEHELHKEAAKIKALRPFAPLSDIETALISEETGLNPTDIQSRFTTYNLENHILQLVGETRDSFVKLFTANVRLNLRGLGI